MSIANAAREAMANDIVEILKLGIETYRNTHSEDRPLLAFPEFFTSFDWGVAQCMARITIASVDHSGYADSVSLDIVKEAY